MSSNYAVMDEDEMTYVEGGISWSDARTVAFSAIGFLISKFVGGVGAKLMEGAIAASAAWIKSAIDTAILIVMCYPGKVFGTVVAIGLLGAAHMEFTR